MPFQLSTVREQPATGHGGAAQLGLEGREVGDLYDPAEPAAAGVRTGTDGLTERRLLRGGVLEHRDDLHVLVVGERQDHVPGAETGVHTALDRFDPQPVRDAFGGGLEAVGLSREGNVIQVHDAIVAPATRATKSSASPASV